MSQSSRHFALAALAAPALFALASLAGCVHATPVAAAPLDSEEAPKLQAALVGKCKVTATQKEGGPVQTDPGGLSWTFGPDGQASYTALGFTARFKYRLEGRNVMMDGPYKAIRVDDFTSSTMKWFVYDKSETFFCARS